MEISKRDWIYFGIILIVMAVTSCAVEDSRAMTPEEKVVEVIKEDVDTHIEDAYYITYLKPTPTEEPQEEVEEVIEEVYEEPVEEVYEEEVYEEEYVEETGMTYLGNFEITAYEWTGNPCANGNYPTEWYTVACNSLPFGTRVYIDNVGYFVVEDRGASWHSDNWMDIYMGDVLECYHWGRQYIDVYLVD